MNSNPSSPSSAGSLTDKVSQTGHHLKEVAREAAGQMKQSVSSTAADLKASAVSMADQRRTQAADQVGRVGQTLHSTARSMEEEDPNIAHYAHQLADRIDHVAEYVRNRDLNALKNDATDFARRHPVAFFGGLFVAGLAIGNLVKAGAAAASGGSVADGTSNPNPSSPRPPEPAHTAFGGDEIPSASAAGI